MSNMQLSDSDKEMIKSYTQTLLNRRKQLCPLEMSIENVERLYIPSYFYNTLQDLFLRDVKLPGYMHKNTYVDLRLPFNIDLDVISTARAHIQVNRGSGTRLITTADNGTPLMAIKSSPGYRAYAEWCAKVVEVELTNRVVAYVVRHVLNTATTYKQLFKALPESMQAVAVQADIHDKQNDWAWRNQRSKLKEVLRINNKEGAERARNLPAYTNEMLNRRRALVEQMLATSVMLPAHDGLGADSVFQNSWVEGITLDTTKV